MLPSGFSSSFSPAFHSSFFHTVLGIVSPLARILRVLIEKVKPASSYRSNDSLNNDFHSHTSFSKILQNIAVSWLDKRFGNFGGLWTRFGGMVISVFDRVHLIAWSLCFLPSWHLQEFRPSCYNIFSESSSEILEILYVTVCTHLTSLTVDHA